MRSWTVLACCKKKQPQTQAILTITPKRLDRRLEHSHEKAGKRDLLEEPVKMMGVDLQEPAS